MRFPLSMGHIWGAERSRCGDGDWPAPEKERRPVQGDKEIRKSAENNSFWSIVLFLSFRRYIFAAAICLLGAAARAVAEC